MGRKRNARMMCQRMLILSKSVIFCLNLSWFGLTNDHEHFLQESCDAHLFFITSSHLHKIPSGGIYFCFGRTTIINFCKL